MYSLVPSGSTCSPSTVVAICTNLHNLALQSVIGELRPFVIEVTHGEIRPAQNPNQSVTSMPREIEGYEGRDLAG